jgi:cell division septation protein DedD
MTESLDFAITKKRLIALLGCLFFSGLLLYGAGIVTGMLVKPGMALRTPVTVTPEQQRSASEQKGANSQPNAAPVSSVPTKTENASFAGPDASQANEGNGHTSLRLSVQVASFLELVRAQRLANTLKQQGFGSISIGQSNIDQETWHVVWLGPYQDWDSASQTVAELQRSYDLQPVIRAVAAN